MSSGIFVAEDEVVNPSDRPRTFKYNTDLLAGFRQAVQNNQQQLAMTYLLFIVNRLDEFLAEATGDKSEPDAPAARKPAGRPKKAAADDEVGVFEGSETV